MISCKVCFQHHFYLIITDLSTADTDAEYIGKLTKKDLTDFYAHYISTSSTQRAKLSVHLQAQSKPKEPTLDEKKQAAIAALSVILTEQKITPDTSSIQSHIDNVSSAEGIADAVSAYLSTLSLDKSTTDTMLDSAKAALGVADAGLPAEPEVKNDAASSSGAGQPVLIKDVYAWKAGMQVSAGVRPVRPLEEFVEIAERL
jgi:insulysin